MSVQTLSPRIAQTTGGVTPKGLVSMLFETTLPSRFWSKVYAAPSGCWLWMGGKVGEGYGQYWESSARPVRVAHRVSYEDLIGAIPTLLTLDHLCRVRNCVNPWHVEPVTQRENTLRGIGPSAKFARATHCVNGHPLTPENLQPVSTVPRWRRCKICSLAIWRKSYYKRRALRAALEVEGA